MNHVSLCAGEWRRKYDQCGKVSTFGTHTSGTFTVGAFTQVDGGS